MAVLGLLLMTAGLLLSGAAMPLALQATRGEGPRKLRPLSGAYWWGLSLIVLGGRLQMGA